MYAQVAHAPVRLYPLFVEQCVCDVVGDVEVFFELPGQFCFAVKHGHVSYFHWL